MAQFVKEFELPIELTQPLFDLVRSDATALQPSPLYSGQEKQKLLDTSRRVSEFKTLPFNSAGDGDSTQLQTQLLQKSKALVEHLSAIETDVSFSLVENDITYIR
eukprot:TRINITY_DN12306_c0_g2_i3.p4 TRINITY_DN12306_c0_g2~~TRINITY_DN12306_c0_g2_i3.p4  ORF type:complete len:105 (+),score=25.19 TRINITY_DN12306_c0_g2_i3:1173-1487(+)